MCNVLVFALQVPAQILILTLASGHHTGIVYPSEIFKAQKLVLIIKTTKICSEN